MRPTFEEALGGALVGVTQLDAAAAEEEESERCIICDNDGHLARRMCSISEIGFTSSFSTGEDWAQGELALAAGDGNMVFDG